MNIKTKMQVVSNLTVTYYDDSIEVMDSHSTAIVKIDLEALKIMQSTIRQNGNGVIKEKESSKSGQQETGKTKEA